MRISTTVEIYPSTVRIDEHLQLSDYEENQFIEISLINIPVTSLIPQNSTLVLKIFWKDCFYLRYYIQLLNQ